MDETRLNQMRTSTCPIANDLDMQAQMTVEPLQNGYVRCGSDELSLASFSLYEVCKVMGIITEP
jgi:hypothetical protein